jgi:hypothetical protein
MSFEFFGDSLIDSSLLLPQIIQFWLVLGEEDTILKIPSETLLKS